MAARLKVLRASLWVHDFEEAEQSLRAATCFLQSGFTACASLTLGCYMDDLGAFPPGESAYRNAFKKDGDLKKMGSH